MTRRVAVTGVGAVTPVAETLQASWDKLLAGSSGADWITRFDPSAHDLRTTIACEAPIPAVPEMIDERAAGRATHYAMGAAEEALRMAGYTPWSPDWTPSRAGTSIACAFGGVPEFDNTVRSGDRPTPRFLLQYLPNLPGGHLSIAVDARGPSRAPATACAAGTHAIADAVADIRAGRADVMLAGGAEGAVSPTGVGGFEAMRALSGERDTPSAASRPFDADRSGFVLGEGSGILVLESVNHARGRGVDPLAVIAGTGRTADATHPTQPADDGAGLRRAIERTLADADLSSGTVDHVSAHATGTPAGDTAEATALAEIFESIPPTTSIKSHLGHALGAAGAIEAAVAVLSIANDLLPPTINYDTPDPACDLPVVTTPHSTSVETVLSTSAGFGGANGAILIESP